jgi:ArsR family transcriptional regulator, lead/cadmium/zinc/bismuth-responsive transcriptional repressor
MLELKMTSHDLHSARVVCLSEGETHDDIETLNNSLIAQTEANRLGEVFKALADPTRLRLISLLLDHEVCVHTLEDLLGMSQSAISHQLRYLRQMQLVRYRKVGRHVYYALDDDHVRRLFEEGLLHVRHG